MGGLKHKKPLKTLISGCEHSLRKQCQKNTRYDAGVFVVVLADQGMVSIKIQN
jgi:hypothetical protein